MQIVDVFRARIVDITNTSFIIEITGDEEKIEGFVEVLRPLGITEMARTGVVVMARGAGPAPELSNGNGKNSNGYHFEDLPAEYLAS